MIFENHSISLNSVYAKLKGYDSQIAGSIVFFQCCILGMPSWYRTSE